MEKKLKCVGMVMLLGAAVFLVVTANSSATETVGQLVGDSEAAMIIGGACQNHSTTNCPNPNKDGCSSCQKVTGGSDYYGEICGDCYCSSDCGSYAKETCDDCG